MLSLVAAQLLYYLLLGPWKDPNGFNFPQSVMFQYDAMVPTLISGTRVNVSLLIALGLSLAGRALRFACKVTEVRAASAEEIAHRHVHGGHGHHH